MNRARGFGMLVSVIVAGLTVAVGAGLMVRVFIAVAGL